MTPRNRIVTDQIAGATFTAASVHHIRGATEPRHGHDRFHVSYVWSGRGHSERRSIRWDRRDAIWCYPAGAVHRWIPSSPRTRSLNIELSEARLTELGCTEGEAFEHLAKRPWLETELVRLLFELSGPPEDREASVSMQLAEILGSQSEHEPRGCPPWAAVIRELLEDRWDDPLELRDLAEAAGVHPVTISRSFRRLFGDTFARFRRRLRVERSLGPLLDERMPLSELALACGFADQSHFTRAFREFVGQPPNALRRHLQSDGNPHRG
ncbi:MAG: AraC family transcriptional regulator [Planctomycetota bacterium]